MRVIFAAFAMFIAVTVGVHALSATSTATIAVNPISSNELWYKPTPITVQIKVTNFSGPGITPVTGYQYALKWDPTVLQWLSGPKVGAGTPTPLPVLPCSNLPQIITWGTATATPTNWVPTWTPTPTDTPLTTTPSNTPTKTGTPTKTPTPGGYVLVGCSSFGTAVPSGVIGTFKFQPIATARSVSQLTLRDEILLNINHPLTPLPFTATNGTVYLGECEDINGDMIVNGLDLSQLATHFLGVMGEPGPPTYLAAADLNHDGTINGLDLGLLAAGFLQFC